MQLHLLWEDPLTGDEVEKTVALPAFFGRLESNTISLHSGQVSRKHAGIFLKHNKPTLQDLNSTNGVMVNGQKIGEIELEDGDGIAIGPFHITVTILPPPPLPKTIKLAWSGQASRFTLPVLIGRTPNNDIALPLATVSARHARIEGRSDGALWLVDLKSSNGTRLNGEAISEAVLNFGDHFQVGDVDFDLLGETVTQGEDETEIASANKQTVVMSPQLLQATVMGQKPVAVPRPEFPPVLFNQPIVPMADLKRLGYPIAETNYLAVGGGLGSFAWVDLLRVVGVPAEKIAVVGFEAEPHGRYKRLAENSQIPAHERLRSNSDACPDNIWGWPGYGIREVWASLKRGELKNAGKILYQLTGEPALVESFTPRADQVYASIEQEAKRIGWDNMWHFGRVRAIRKTDDGRYVIAYSTSHDQPRAERYRFFVANYVHVAVGYPGVRFLPDLQRYRAQYNDFKRVVNAYEEHNHVYADLIKNGGIVLVRGRGIVSSRIVQRLYEARKQNPNIAILHLMRAPNPAGSRYGKAQRLVRDHWEMQPFNFPKACWGGDMREIFANASDAERDQLMNDWGGTTTADRTDWQEIVAEGIREGWYEIRFGQVDEVTPAQNGESHVVLRLKGKGAIRYQTEMPANYIIDATGLNAKIDSHPLLKDLVDTYQLPRTIKNQLQTTAEFEIEPMQNGAGRFFSAGVNTLGGKFAPVDSFLGLQFAALRSLTPLQNASAPHVRQLSGFRSVAGWLRWARGVKP